METNTTMLLPKIRLNSVTFLLGILLFFLPFVTIKCKGDTVITNNGIGLAFGINYKTSKSIDSNENKIGKKISFTEKESGKMYVSALIALLLGITGLILSIMYPPPNKINAMIGVLAALAMIALMIQIKSEISDRSSHSITDGFSASFKVTVVFTVWYYLSMVCFIAASFFSYWRKPVRNAS